MKKTLSLLLTVAMLLAMIPAVVVSTSAATPTVDPIKITTHSSTSVNYANGDKTKAPVNWDGFWEPVASDSHRFGSYFSETVSVVGQFDKPTKVGHIDLSAQYYRGRSRNVQVLLSTDAETWVDLGSITCNESNDKKFRVYSVYVPSQYANTEFSYVKILKDWNKFQDKDQNGDGVIDTWFDFNYAVVYPRTASDEPAAIKHVSHNSDNNSRSTDEQRAQVWNNVVPTKSFQVYNQGAGTEMMRGQFENPTVIDAIQVTVDGANGNRVQNCQFQASVDGETWTTIADTGTISYANYNNSIFHLNSTDKTTAYNYIRIIKNNTWSFSFLTLGVFGTEQGADFIGTQVKKDTDTWSLRLVSTIDVDTVKGVGYEITAMAEGMSDKVWDKSTQVVYTSIKGADKTSTALDLGGKYIFTATIHSISIEDYDAIEFFVRPYVIDANDNKVYSVEQSFTFVDGELQ